MNVHISSLLQLTPPSPSPPPSKPSSWWFSKKEFILDFLTMTNDELEMALNSAYLAHLALDCCILHSSRQGWPNFEPEILSSIFIHGINQKQVTILTNCRKSNFDRISPNQITILISHIFHFNWDIQFDSFTALIHILRSTETNKSKIFFHKSKLCPAFSVQKKKKIPTFQKIKLTCTNNSSSFPIWTRSKFLSKQ